MQNIIEILKELGIEVEEGKVASLNAKVAENYKTVAEFNKKITSITEERDNFKSQYETASETLKGFDGVDVDGLKNSVAEWRKKAEDAEAEFNKKIHDRDYADALNAEIEKYSFSSDAAKRAVIEEVKAANLPLSGGVILGLDQLMGQIKEKDSGAFAADEGDDGKPYFSKKLNQTKPDEDLSSEDISRLYNEGKITKAEMETMIKKKFLKEKK